MNVAGRGRSLRAAAVAVTLAGAACQSSRAESSRGERPTERPRAEGLRTAPSGNIALITITPGNGSDDVWSDGPVVLKVINGRIRYITVTVRGAAGQVQGETSPDGRQWQSRWALEPGVTYRVTASVVGGDGKQRTVTGFFRTRPASHPVSVGIVAPWPGETVGVGMPIILHFEQPVSSKDQVEAALEVRASKPVVGAWHWFGDQDVIFRTRRYWPGHTKVRLIAHLRGVHLAAGRYGGHDLNRVFHIGDSHITVASARNHHQVTWINGRVARRMPISMGKATEYKYTTTSGVHLTMEKRHHVVMDSSTVGCPPGCPDYYRHDVHYAVRISHSGEYEHGAPWSVGDQGLDNVSHGCINMDSADAAWFYNHAQRGDVVTIVGTTRTLAPTNGWGYWQLSWPEWLEGSDLKADHGHVPAAPTTRQ